MQAVGGSPGSRPRLSRSLKKLDGSDLVSASGVGHDGGLFLVYRDTGNRSARAEELVGGACWTCFGDRLRTGRAGLKQGDVR